MSTQLALMILKQMTSAYISSNAQAIKAARQSLDVMGLVRVCNTKIEPNAQIKWLSEVKLASRQFNAAVEERADEIIKKQIHVLLDLLQDGDMVGYMKCKGPFYRDIRHLSGHAPMALKKALREIGKLEQVARQDQAASANLEGPVYRQVA